ncbi:bifunctional UDP-N-acetylmuramoyl-tripeptide:D-alanyl-D-alanine ligase/alanine racemase [Arcticibacterium luteifluviistationis]|uniref:bifunctional UDP-N-acetylmuramoyl-tripeptide:D-alanyl-D-alanine ligase/alanine racemase n=1 Tax=Arcticibacterium luteifluviistationis TaxID=1784714 RepID=UPI001E4CE61F|nr:bifunctional UDP-N-acetylmuramoyl-tripeptide:D-alanyl-D-alanine ligase/alanine racemase [Arcticibacterium luteifluviistationis]
MLQPKNKILLTDSRFLSQPSETLFIAIKGDRHDGHLFIEQLIKEGVDEFIVQKEWLTEHSDLSEKATFWPVDNTVHALQSMVKKHRESFDLPVVGITGSNGKTIVKEWLSSILQGSFSLVKSPRSYNSQIGVPLSAWQINENHTLGIFEAGISQPAEMQKLQDILKPDFGIFTNIGSAHNEGFRSKKQKITEKLRLFRHSKVLVYCQDYVELDEEIRIFLSAVNPKIELIAWSKNQKGTTQIEVIKKKDFTLLSIYWNGEEYSLRIPFIDDASIENVIHCFFMAFTLLKENHSEIESLSIIQSGIDGLKPVAMRLELKEGIRNCYLIDDSYNNDFGGLAMALNFMNQHHINRQKTVILSDVLQSGLNERELYQRINDLLIGAGVQKVIGIGPDISKNASFIRNIDCYLSVNDFIANYPFKSFNNELILIKGARNFSFEKIVSKLVNKAHGTVFEINLDAITHNLNYYKSKVKPETKIMAMVKASAYGSGSTEIASLLQYHRVDYLAVAYTDEAVELRQNGIESPILILNTQPESFSKVLEYDLEPELYSLKNVKEFSAFIDAAHEGDSKVKVHLKLDTGMNRLGFKSEDILELIQLLKANSKLEVASIFSHLAGADNKAHDTFSKEQINTFKELSDLIIEKLGYQPLRHILNSAGIIRYPNAAFDMVRLGIGLYGIEANNQSQNDLQTVGTLKTTISQIKTVKKGETIGYGRVGKANHDVKVATIAIGYADGFDRRLSNGKGQVWVNGTLCPTIGNVCMDMTMIDVTKASAVEDDSVEIFGTNQSIFSLSETLETIPYEILTKIGHRVKRVFFKE